jgi:hypothetical protein
MQGYAGFVKKLQTKQFPAKIEATLEIPGFQYPTPGLQMRQD